MSEWISVKDRVPESEMDCWVCDSARAVFDMRYEMKCANYDSHPIKYVPGFTARDGEWRGDLYKGDDPITHWMPYYTPEPPNE